MSKNEEYVHVDNFSVVKFVNSDQIEFDSNMDPSPSDDTTERKKKVRFPEDNELVSHYFETKNYWVEHKLCSSEELINSYKKACDHCNTRPIPILLEQLKGIDSELCHERYDMLNMSNVKLDLKHIECMEEVFKRVQFKTLNFENSNLDDESSASLFEIIEFYESCLKLNISMNSKISCIGFTACSKMLKKTPALESIELKGIMFTDATIPPLNRALRCGSHLKVLHMENSNICSKNLLILTSALKLNVHLKELYLSSNRLVPSDGIQLGSLLKVNRFIEILDVRNNSLGDIGLSHICDGLCEQMIPQPSKADDEIQGQGILCLILWSNSITHNGMPALSEALKANKSLQSLNLGNNPISSEGIHALRDGLLVNRSLLRLSLPCCRITCEGGVAIAEYLADTKQLLRLDLRDNDIRTAGLMAISLSMKVNKSLIRLDVDQVSKRDPVRSLNVKGFFETQLESLRLIQDRIQENKKDVMKNQEMELAHTQGLSNNPQNTPDSTVPLPIASPDTDIPELMDSNSPPSPQKTTISLIQDSPDENINFANINTAVENSVSSFTNMSLSLSKVIDSSFDSPCSMSNPFSNKVLSPTDTILEFSLSDNDINMITNSVTDDGDLFLVNVDPSGEGSINVKIDTNINGDGGRDESPLTHDSTNDCKLSSETLGRNDFTVLSLSLEESSIPNGNELDLLNNSMSDEKSSFEPHIHTGVNIHGQPASVNGVTSDNELGLPSELVSKFTVSDEQIHTDSNAHQQSLDENGVPDIIGTQLTTNQSTPIDIQSDLPAINHPLENPISK